MDQEPIEVRMKDMMLMLKELNCVREEALLVHDSITMDILILVDGYNSIVNEHRQTIIEMSRAKDEKEQALSEEDAIIYEEKIKKLRDEFNLQSSEIVSRNRNRITELKNDMARRIHYIDSVRDGFVNIERLLGCVKEIVSREKIRTDDVLNKVPEYTTLIKAKKDLESLVNAGKRLKITGMFPQEEAKDHVANETALSNLNINEI